MKRISKYFLCLFAVVLTAGCAEDKLGETEFDPTVYEGDKAYHDSTGNYAVCTRFA